MDLSTLTDEDLDALRAAVLIEIERRTKVRGMPQMIEQLVEQYQQATGRKDGDAWKQPTGAHDAYRVGAKAVKDGKTWESLTPANVWKPGTTGWREVTAPGTAAAWVQPTGAHDTYPVGARVTWKDQTWTSTAAANVWEPGVFGWTASPKA